MNFTGGLGTNYLQRRYPIGAEVLPNGGTHFRVWAPRPKQVEVLLEAVLELPRPYNCNGRRRDTLRALSRRPLRALAIASGWMTPVAFLTRPRVFSRKDRTVLSGGGPRPFKWTDRDWQGIGMEGQVIYEMHVGTFTPKGPAGRGGGQLPHWRLRHHGAGGNAGRGVSRPLRLGLRRRRPLRSHPAVRRAGRLPPLSWTAPTSWAWASSWTWCTTTSAPTATT